MPHLNNSEGKIVHRAASPLELFFDLMFVAVFAAIATLLHEITIEHITLAIVLFLVTYLFWGNVNMYMMRFYSTSYIVRVGIGLVMIPLLFLAGIRDYHSTLSIQIISVAFFASRIILSSLWYITTFKNKHVTNNQFKLGVKFDLQSFIGSAFIGVIPLFMPTTFILIVSLISSLVFEIAWVALKYRRNQNLISFQSESMPLLDMHLLRERFLLFFIIIFGEGIITSVATLQIDSNNLIRSIGLPIIVFLTVFAFFIRIYEEFTSFNIIIQSLSLRTIFYNAISAFNILLLYTLLNTIVESHDHVDFPTQLTLFISITFITILHVIANLREINKHEKNTVLYKFYKLDLQTLLVMQVIATSVLFFNNPIIIIFSVFAFFVIHILAIPYRYQYFKKNLLENEAQQH